MVSTKEAAANSFSSSITCNVSSGIFSLGDIIPVAAAKKNILPASNTTTNTAILLLPLVLPQWFLPSGGAANNSSISFGNTVVLPIFVVLVVIYRIGFQNNEKYIKK